MKMFKEIGLLAMFRILEPSDAFFKTRSWIEIQPQKMTPLAKGVGLVKCGNTLHVALWVLSQEM